MCVLVPSWRCTTAPAATFLPVPPILFTRRLPRLCAALPPVSPPCIFLEIPHSRAPLSNASSSPVRIVQFILRAQGGKACLLAVRAPHTTASPFIYTRIPCPPHRKFVLLLTFPLASRLFLLPFCLLPLLLVSPFLYNLPGPEADPVCRCRTSSASIAIVYIS